MIGRLRGIILEKQAPDIVLDVQGVGYEVAAPMSTFFNLPAIDEEVTLFTHLIVREDAQLLYG
ncbi:MAG: Holliday junction branch migration protein RuvA, partial [Gammaproteobacteria bacterium]